MYAMNMVTWIHQYTPNVSIYTSTMDPMGIDILDVFFVWDAWIPEASTNSTRVCRLNRDDFRGGQSLKHVGLLGDSNLHRDPKWYCKLSTIPKLWIMNLCVLLFGTSLEFLFDRLYRWTDSFAGNMHISTFMFFSLSATPMPWVPAICSISCSVVPC
jgi:hypothetical protein